MLLLYVATWRNEAGAVVEEPPRRGGAGPAAKRKKRRWLYEDRLYDDAGLAAALPFITTSETPLAAPAPVVRQDLSNEDEDDDEVFILALLGGW